MSDALSDMQRDEWREEAFGKYLFQLAKYLSRPTAMSRKKVFDAAESCDAVRRGFNTGKTNLKAGLEELLEKLVSQDKKTWMKFLRGVQGARCWQAVEEWKVNIYDKLKSMSPFKDHLLLNVDYGFGFGHVHGIQEVLDKLIEEKGFVTYDGDEYYLAIKKPELVHLEWESPYKGDARKKRK